MSTTKDNSIFKKSVLSVVVISLIAGGLALLYKQQAEPMMKTPVDPHFITSMKNTSMKSTNLKERQQQVTALPISEQEVELTLQDNLYDEIVIVTKVEESEPAVMQINEPVLIENKLLFAFDSIEIKASYFQSLNETAQLMQSADKQELWQVVGYADQSGNAVYNKKLAQKRAATVAQFLVNKGVDGDQLVILSLGASHPQQHLSNKENNHLDRRVEIHAYQAEITALAKQLNKSEENRKIIMPKAPLSQKEQKKELPVVSFLTLPEYVSTVMQF